MKIVIQNILSLFRRFALALWINIIGLSVAFAAFIILMIQVYYEQSFDCFHSEADSIYRMDLQMEENDEWSAIHSSAFIQDVISSSPHIEAATLINPFNSKLYLLAGEDTEENGFREIITTCFPDITNVFDFTFVEGDVNSLNDVEKVIIPESMAKRMFGNQSAVGQQIHSNDVIWTKSIRDLTVGAVYKDFPTNSQLNNVIYAAMDKSEQNVWGGRNFVCYLKLDNPQSASTVVEHFNATYDYQNAFSKVYNEDMKMSLMPLTDIYYAPNQMSNIFKTGNTSTRLLLILIAVLIIVIASINFTNFSTAISPMRMKSINTQKVLGCSDAKLRGALLIEAIFVSLLSWLLGLFIIWLLGNTNTLSFIGADIRLQNNIGMILISGPIALAVGLVAGLYPAWYNTSFLPALVLKGSFGLSPSGRKLRTSLIGFQYVISIVLIVSAVFIQLQNRYMRSFNQGFDKDQIAIVELSRNHYNQNKDVYVNKLKEYPGIEDVAFSYMKLGASDGYSFYSFKYNDYSFTSFLIEVSHNFMDVMGIPVTTGRNFTVADTQDESMLTFIFNKNVQDQIPIELGASVDIGWEIPSRTAGFVGDVKITSLRKEADNISFVINPAKILPVSYIRVKAGTDIHSAVSHIRKSLSDIDSAYPFEIEFYDEIFDQLYRKEAYLNKIITLFSILAIMISIAGIFGLVLFETQYRKKEIGLRKVFGATLHEILNMFNSIYFRIILVCFVIAAPIAWFAINSWLQNFAYRTPIYWWVFIFSFAAVTAITLLTITIQNWRSAMANPVDSIKTE